MQNYDEDDFESEDEKSKGEDMSKGEDVSKGEDMGRRPDAVSTSSSKEIDQDRDNVIGAQEIYVHEEELEEEIEVYIILFITYRLLTLCIGNTKQR